MSHAITFPAQALAARAQLRGDARALGARLRAVLSVILSVVVVVVVLPDRPAAA